MQNAVLMESVIAAIIGLNPMIVQDICDQISSKDSLVSAANFNSPIQTVIAGHRNAVERAIELSLKKGAKERDASNERSITLQSFKPDD